MKKINKKILDDLVAQGLIDSYVLTKHYAAHKYSDEVRQYLIDHNISQDGESRHYMGGKEELKIYFLW